MERYRKDVWKNVESGDVVLISRGDEIEQTAVNFAEIKDGHVIVSNTVRSQHYPHPRWRYEADYPVYIRERE